MSADTVLIRAESSCGSTIGNAVLHGPQHRVVVVLSGRYIGEGVPRTGIRHTLRAPQEGHDLCAGAVLIRAEGGGGCTAGSAVVHSPKNGVIVIGVASLKSPLFGGLEFLHLFFGMVLKLQCFNLIPPVSPKFYCRKCVFSTFSEVWLHQVKFCLQHSEVLFL